MTIVVRPGSYHKRIARAIVRELGEPSPDWQIAQSDKACALWLATQDLGDRSVEELALDWLYDCGLITHGSGRGSYERRI